MYSRDKARIQLKECEFHGNKAGKHGGALSFDKDTIAGMTKAIFQNNWAPRGGGAINMESGTTVQLSSCQFKGNHAEQHGAAVYIRSQAFLDAHVVSFVQNKASGNGGAIHASESGMKLVQCQLEGNSVEGTTMSGALHVQVGTEGNGGAVYLQNGASIVAHATSFTNNSAQQGGGAIFATDIGSRIECTLCNFRINIAHTTYGGAVFLFSSAVMYAETTEFRSNTAFIGPAVIALSASSLDCASCQFEHNSVHSWSSGLSGRQRCTAVFASGSYFKCNDCRSSPFCVCCLRLADSA